MKKIFIRVDVSETSGLGHAIRCLALAHVLSDDFEITFIYKQLPLTVVEDIKKSGFSALKVPDENAFFDILSEEVIVVSDDYSAHASFYQKIKDNGSKLVCIDDLHEKEFICDLIINHNPAAKAEEYKSKIYTQFALGTDYALLRPAFTKPCPEVTNTTNPESIFICFGGSDPKHLTQRAIALALKENTVKTINVVTGPAFVPGHQEKKIYDPRINYFHAIDENKMHELMCQSDVAIVPSSGILLETLSLGCRTISGMYAENQKFIYSHFKDAGLFFDAGNFDDVELQTAFRLALDKNNALNPAKFKIEPGKIMTLFKQLSLSGSIHVRPANIEDAEITYKWAIDPAVRAYSFSTHAITKEEHFAWFSKKINEPSCDYFLVKLNSVTIGSIRFDMTGKKAKISYLLASENRGKGLGTILLYRGLEHFYHHTRHRPAEVFGEVLFSNLPSVKIFERLGFSKEKKESHFIFSKPFH